jgi:hypothetical protein
MVGKYGIKAPKMYNYVYYPRENLNMGQRKGWEQFHYPKSGITSENLLKNKITGYVFPLSTSLKGVVLI